MEGWNMAMCVEDESMARQLVGRRKTRELERSPDRDIHCCVKPRGSNWGFNRQR